MTKHFIKNYLIPLFLLFGFILISSCSEDFDITSEWKEITVVYGLLDPGEVDQYIRIERAYLSETDAEIVAGVSDSIYYDDLDVTLIEFDEEGNEVQTLTLDKINGTDEGFVKEPGLFANEPNTLYKLSNYNLRTDYSYQLVARNISSGNMVTATTPIVDTNVVFVSNQSLNSKQPIDWTNTIGDFRIRFGAPRDAIIFDMDMTFDYTERPSNPSDTSTILSSHTIGWSIFGNQRVESADGTNNFAFEFPRLQFYDNVSAQLAAVPAQGLRFAESNSFFLTMGAEELQKYIDASLNFGIATSQEKPRYTNIEGGFGIFSSRFTKKIEGVRLARASQDSLSCGSFTDQLNFAAHPASLIWPSCQ